MRTLWNEFKAVHAGIRIFDPLLFEDTVVSKIMEDFNTKCYVMNNKEKLFQQKQSLETLFLLMKKTTAKKFKVRMFYHLQDLFWVLFVQGVFVGGFMSGEFLSRGFCPDTIMSARGLTMMNVGIS